MKSIASSAQPKNQAQYVRRSARRIVTCSQAMAARDGRWLTTAGIVLVRQKPGSAKGVMFITIEDESGIANLVVWPSHYERQRPIILNASIMAIHGRVQREGEVVHIVANRLTDMSKELAGVGERDENFFRCHMVEVMNSTTVAPAVIPAVCPRKACAPATSMCAICISIASR